MLLMANCTMHNQKEYVSDFEKFGFKVLPEPLFREVSGTEDAWKAAAKAVRKAIELGVEGILLGGRTDLVVYTCQMALAEGLEVFIAETERIRDENDRFVFKLKGVQRILSERLF